MVIYIEEQMKMYFISFHLVSPCFVLFHLVSPLFHCFTSFHLGPRVGCEEPVLKGSHFDAPAARYDTLVIVLARRPLVLGRR